MSNKVNDSNAEQFLSSIIEKASVDSAFKSKLISNPKAAIESLKGGSLNIPAGKRIVVTDQSDQSKVYINVPASNKVEDMQLSDEQLELVSGGSWFNWIPMPPPYRPIFTWWKR